MAAKVENNEDDSFIILGTSPGTSLDIKCDGLNGHASFDKLQIEDAMKDLSMEANMAMKAHFKLGDCPSPASMMVASTIITDDKSTEELQKHFGDILDENLILKETLQHNNDSMKEQFLLIASCQEDMVKTHALHKEKFDETKELVERLRQENKKLKQDFSRLTGSGETLVSSDSGNARSGPSSAVEFVTSPDDDTINKLTSQLELVEKQRREVIVENEKLTWQKESLESLLDAASREKEELKEKMRKLESSALTEELDKRENIIKQMETTISSLTSDLRTAQFKIMELENVKIEYLKQKSGYSETNKMYKEQINVLNNRLKEASTTVFQPVRFSLSTESDSSEYSGLKANVKLYDRTLKHLAELLNSLTQGTSDSLFETLGVVEKVHEFKQHKSPIEHVSSGLVEVQKKLEEQHVRAMSNIGQVKCTLSIFEGIFMDYNEVLKRTTGKNNVPTASNVEALTAALVARGQELEMLRGEMNKLKSEKEDRELLRAQLDLYKSDFEAERESRQKMASEKETILTDLRTTQRRNQELVRQLEEARPAPRGAAPSRRAPAPAPSSAPAPAPAPAPAASGIMVYKCPKCMRFSCSDYKAMEDHFDFCLDDF